MNQSNEASQVNDIYNDISNETNENFYTANIKKFFSSFVTFITSLNSNNVLI